MRSTLARHLLIIRLNNYLPIRSAYGMPAAEAAIAHLREILAQQGFEARHDGQGAIELVMRDHPLRSAPPGLHGDRLCAALETRPFRFGEQHILLSLSTGRAFSDNDETSLDPLRRRARVDLLRSPHPEESGHRNEEEAILYRHDMQRAATLLHAVSSGATHFAWRPVLSPRDPGAILYHEALLRRTGEGGELVDGAGAHAALDRIGLAHRLDRQLLSDMVDALEADPLACLSVAISARSLSLDLHGRDAGWNDLLGRLKRDRGLARRLVIELVDHGRTPILAEVQGFTRSLQSLGVRIAVGRFGAGRASVGQLMALAPDIVKLDGTFVHRACRMEGHRARMTYLMELARTVAPIVIVDGVDSARHRRLALEEGACWIVGAHREYAGLDRYPQPAAAALMREGVAALSAH